MKVVSEEKENTETPTINHEKLGGGEHLSLENGGGEKEAGDDTEAWISDWFSLFRISSPKERGISSVVMYSGR